MKDTINVYQFSDAMIASTALVMREVQKHCSNTLNNTNKTVIRNGI
jgi:hypothetical protein